jgi:GNAT superfamily N-acetyltransferase
VRVRRPGTLDRAEASPVSEPALVVRAVSPADRDLVIRLFGPNGACGGCWCMWWRRERGGALWHACQGETNRHDFLRLFAAGKVNAVLALRGDEPVGWCNIEPRETLVRIARVRALARERVAPATWGVGCFYVPARQRGRGLAKALLRGAIELAWRRGAARIEGYPVVVRPGAGMPGAFAWTGVPRLFTAAGFTRMPAPAGARTTYVLERPAA